MNRKTIHKKAKGAISSIVHYVFMTIAVLASVAMLLAAYGGHISPDTFALPSLATLALPIATVCAAAVLLFLLIFRQWQASAVLGVCLAISLPQILRVMPNNVFSHKLAEGDAERCVKVMSFNVIGFEYRNEYYHERCEPIEYILKEDADVVCIQEGELDYTLDQIASIKGETLKKLRSAYPYQTKSLRNVGLLSKVPFKEVSQKFFRGSNHGFMAHYRLKIKGKEVDLLNVHLESIGLSDDDKDLYREYTQPTNIKEKMRQLKEVKHGMLSKLAHAYRRRANQAQELRDTLDRLGENVILCGDFNDTPASWAYLTVLGDDMHDTYRERALGYLHTYHENRFWFHIDHILYRGQMQAHSYKRPKLILSDHYPVVTTLLFEQ